MRGTTAGEPSRTTGTPEKGGGERPPFTFVDPETAEPASPATPAVEEPSVAERHDADAVRPAAPYRPDAGLEDVFEEEPAPAGRRAAPEDYASAYDEFGEGFDEPPRRRGMGLLLFIMALLIVVAVAIGIVYFYQKAGSDAQGPGAGTTPPVVKPPETPVKVKPEQKEQPPATRPKGRKQIYDRILGDGEEQPTRITPSEEKPLPPPQPPADPAPGMEGGGDPLPLPLPPPPALDGGGQGRMDDGGNGKENIRTAEDQPLGTATTDRIAALPETETGAPQPHSATASPEEGGATAIPLPPPPGSSAPAAGEGGSGGTADAQTTDDGGMPTAKPAAAAARANGAEKARAAASSSTTAVTGKPAKAETKRKRATPAPVPARKPAKAVAAVRKERAKRRVARKVKVASGPRPLVPPAVLATEVRAFASPATPRQASRPTRILPAPERKPARVTNFATRKVGNFAPAHDAARKAVAPRTATAVTNAANRRDATRLARAVRPPARTPATRGAATGAGGYLVQLASYRSREDALREYLRMKARHAALLGGLPPRIEKKDLGAAGVFYRLAVGPLPSRDEARRLCNSLIARGERDCLVRRR